MTKKLLFILAVCGQCASVNILAQEKKSVKTGVAQVLDSLASAMNHRNYATIEPFIGTHFKITRAVVGMDSRMALMGIVSSKRPGEFSCRVKKVTALNDTVHVTAKVSVAGGKSRKEDFCLVAESGSLKIDRLDGGILDMLAMKDTTGSRTITVSIPQSDLKKYLGMNADSFNASKDQVHRIANGDTINHINSSYQPDGRWSRVYDDGSFMCEGEYVNGLKEGFWRRKYKNGNVLYECYFHEGKPDGSCKNYYDNGFVKDEGTYVSGLPDGTIKQYYGNGKLKSEKQYSKGTLVCPCVCFKENGRKRKCKL